MYRFCHIGEDLGHILCFTIHKDHYVVPDIVWSPQSMHLDPQHGDRQVLNRSHQTTFSPIVVHRYVAQHVRIEVWAE
jgi:hypothetical protein